jgi:hypothetical protein
MIRLDKVRLDYVKLVCDIDVLVDVVVVVVVVAVKVEVEVEGGVEVIIVGSEIVKSIKIYYNLFVILIRPAC